MATLVLTSVGGLIGGPVGAALGAVIGQTVDRAVLRPRGRQGPRLTELAVQTSSYGRQIPQLFGRMRVAGQVIWATDLIEHRARAGGGKGQPSVTSYSYSASFAVALSTRRIVDVGRIWADGNPLRGVAGDWKVTTGFRLHRGGEDQAPDPLMASVEGLGATPAHRGIAYAVFEDLPLAAFGNRIPSLTFEVIADEAPVSAGEIARAIGGGAIVGDGPAMLVDGFSAYGDGARGVVEALAEIAGAWFAPVAGGLAMRGGAGVGRTIVDEGRARRIAPSGSAPTSIAVAHHDPARDWQVGVQRAVRPGAAGAALSVELPVALSAAEAKAVAERMLARAETERMTRRVSGDVAWIDVVPGDVVSIAGDGGGAWRVTAVAIERHAVMLDLVALVPAPLVTVASAGRVLRAPDAPAGATILHVFETPPLGDAALTMPRVTIVAAGASAGWRRAALQYSLDDGASWSAAGATAAPGVVGIVTAAVAAGPATLIDRRATIDVTLAHAGMTLANADAGALDRGTNLALVGGELLQFGVAEHLGGADWRLRALWRGRRGTGSGAIGAGARFLLIDEDSAVALAVDAAVGGRILVSAAGVGDVVPVEAELVLSGASILPPAPVRVTAALSDEGLHLRWRRRSRIDWRWRDGADAALGEEREAYRVAITRLSGSVETLETVVPALFLASAELADMPVAVAVRQLGTNGASDAAVITI
ncbi:phage tail protein [Sphingomonas radiodurans]